MRIHERALALAAVWLLAAGTAVAEIDLFDIQKDLALGKTTVTAPAGTKETDLAAIAECLEDAEDITLDLSGTQLKAIPNVAFGAAMP